MNKKIKVCLTLDEKNVTRAKKKLHFFGGKFSTLVDVLLEDFLKSEKYPDFETRFKEIEKRLKIIESKLS